MRSSFANQGQICLCGSRIYVQRPIYEKFRDEFVKRTEAMRVVDPSDEKSQMGAIVSQGHIDKVMSYIELAKEEGGKVIAGGTRVQMDGKFSKGYFMRPTMIFYAPHHHRRIAAYLQNEPGRNFWSDSNHSAF